MKYLIVNGDDFGASRGINRGILDAHRHGVLTSASLLVTSPWSEEAAGLAHDAPGLSVGLHLDVSTSEAACRGASQRQLERFHSLLGRAPSHLDVHHNLHRDPRLLPHFLELAKHARVALREHSAVRHFSKFYGQWGGETHLEQIGVESLVRMLRTEIEEGITELSCHPGHADPDHRSGYSIEREVELHTLCDPAVREALAEQAIELVSYHAVREDRCPR